MEGVDRNYANDNDTLTTWVALLMEGVDRNSEIMAEYDKPLSSPSSWRAWIEMQEIQHIKRKCEVALLAEGVDRNTTLLPCSNGLGRSPSSRRAWIEIQVCCQTG